MKAIILSAGQGKRLLPLTADRPKCLLEIQGMSILEWQVRELHKCGVTDITVVTGYGADQVDALVQSKAHLQDIDTFYNPDFATSDNLVSCWKVREKMNEDFILLNGDTLFEAQVLKSVLASTPTPITVTINFKDSYDDDDMKVHLNKNQLINIGKTLSPEVTHGESIGMILFRGEGSMTFRQALEEAMDTPQAAKRWYLSVIDSIAAQSEVLTCSIEGLLWCEVDCQTDIEEADSVLASFPEAPSTDILDASDSLTPTSTDQLPSDLARSASYEYA